MIKLPEKELLRVDEVADFFSVSVRTVYLWIENGHLEIERTPGNMIRVIRESVMKCRFRKPEE